MAPTKTKKNEEFHFPGFTFPTTTPVPDELFDLLLPQLSGAELKVLLYICRRTYGFKKSRDDISLDQMVNGIRKKNGEILDHGTGLSKATVARALKALSTKGIIIRRRNRSSRKGNEPTTYGLNFATPLSQNETRPVSPARQAVSHLRDRQDTVPQETVGQQATLLDDLKSFGLSGKTAKGLLQKYPEPRIRQKIDFLRFQLEQSPGKIISPHGWLRRAIQDDYDPPDGYETPEERSRKREAQKQMAEALARQEENLREKRRKAEERKRQKEEQELALLRANYGTSENELKLWDEILNELQDHATPATFSFARAVHLLSVEEGVAIFATGNSFAVDRIRERFSGLLVEMFRQRGFEVQEMRAIIFGDDH